MKPIFEYIDFRLFLADYYVKHKSEQYSFSYRQFLNKAEVKSPSLYREVVEGKRNLSPKALQGFLNALQISDDEKLYFECLVHFCQSEQEVEKQKFFKTMLTLSSQNNFEIVGSSCYWYYERWYHPVVRELICLPEIEGNTKNAWKLINPKIEFDEFNESVQSLIKHKFIEKNKKGYTQIHPALSSSEDLSKLTLRSYHKQMLGIAKNSLDLLDPKERFAMSGTLALSETAYQKVCLEIQEFQKKCLSIATEDNESVQKVLLCQSLLIPLSHSS
jgi:uncharacterized protein (TIGR02147 family)